MAKQVKIEEVYNKFFFDLAPNFNFFSAVAYSTRAKISGNKGRSKAPNVFLLDFWA
jgi:hypothetical protein